MKEKNKKQDRNNARNDKDVLSQADLIAGSNSFALPGQLHAALETPMARITALNRPYSKISGKRIPEYSVQEKA